MDASLVSSEAPTTHTVAAMERSNPTFRASSRPTMGRRSSSTTGATAYPIGRRQIVTSATHLSEDERYHWLNDSLSVGVGEVRSQEDGPTELVIEWAEVVWEPIAD